MGEIICQKILINKGKNSFIVDSCQTGHVQHLDMLNPASVLVADSFEQKKIIVQATLLFEQSDAFELGMPSVLGISANYALFKAVC